MTAWKVSVCEIHYCLVGKSKLVGLREGCPRRCFIVICFFKSSQAWKFGSEHVQQFTGRFLTDCEMNSLEIGLELPFTSMVYTINFGKP